MRCGKCNIPAQYLDGHHVEQTKKYQPLTRRLNRRWLRHLCEIIEFGRDQPNGSEPSKFVFQRYQQERQLLGADAKTCAKLEMEG